MLEWRTVQLRRPIDFRLAQAAEAVDHILWLLVSSNVNVIFISKSGGRIWFRHGRAIELRHIAGPNPYVTDL